MQTQKKSHNSVYGIIGMVLLCLVGVMIGYTINGSDRVNRSTMTKYDCNMISNRIIEAARNNQPDLIAQLNKVYSENCLNRDFQEKKVVANVEHKKLSDTTCEAIEELLKDDLFDENSNDWMVHKHNAETYQKLAKQGCPKNQNKYLQLSHREQEIVGALGGNIKEDKLTTCEQIQIVLEDKLQCVNSLCNDAEEHIHDARIYANLSERGCSINSERYRSLAKQELEIARALTDDRLDDRHEATEMVETYKRLQMQAEAAKMIEKAKKLANPAIDFIIQLEKIIEE